MLCDIRLGEVGHWLIIIIIIIIKRGWQCKAGRERLTPYQSEDPNPTTPTHRKKEEKGKTVGDLSLFRPNTLMLLGDV